MTFLSVHLVKDVYQIIYQFFHFLFIGQCEPHRFIVFLICTVVYCVDGDTKGVVYPPKVLYKKNVYEPAELHKWQHIDIRFNFFDIGFSKTCYPFFRRNENLGHVVFVYQKEKNCHDMYAKDTGVDSVPGEHIIFTTTSYNKIGDVIFPFIIILREFIRKIIFDYDCAFSFLSLLKTLARTSPP